VIVADDFKETVGIPRIIEALSCHSWPNLIMKGSFVRREDYDFVSIHLSVSYFMHDVSISQIFRPRFIFLFDFMFCC